MKPRWGESLSGKAAARLIGLVMGVAMRSTLILIWQQLARARSLAGDPLGAQRATRNARTLLFAQHVEHRKRGYCPVPYELCEECNG